jgi:hypothetical protein
VEEEEEEEGRRGWGRKRSEEESDKEGGKGEGGKPLECTDVAGVWVKIQTALKL